MRKVFQLPLGIVFSAARQRPFSPLSHLLIRQANTVIATSPQTQSYLHRPSVLIPHGVDCEAYRPAEDRERNWSDLGFGGRYGIGVFGRVRHQKGTDLFVEALIELLPRHPDFTAIIVGLAKPRDAGFVARMQHAIDRAGLGRRILFLGERPHQDLPGLLAAVSICVAPQRYEGFGLVPLEAAACGTPVVATRVGAAPDIVKDGESGLLVEPGQLSPLRDAIELLMGDAARRSAMGRASRRQALAEFDIAREVASYLGAYEAVWRSHRPLQATNAPLRRPEPEIAKLGSKHGC